MTGRRSRQGCEECRHRRRKCDEAKPTCGSCSSYHRTCNYTLKLVWGGRPMGAAAGGPGGGGGGGGSSSSSSSSSSSTAGALRKRGSRSMRPASSRLVSGRGESLGWPDQADPAGHAADNKGNNNTHKAGRATAAAHDQQEQQEDSIIAGSVITPSTTTPTPTPTAAATIAASASAPAAPPTASTALTLPLPPTLNVAPPCLPNGVPLSPPYQRLLHYFTKDILASLSVHPSIHQDLCQGLVPTMLHSPHLLSAGLALSAAGLVSRGLTNVAGADLPRVIEHLQLSGLALLRQALQRGMRNSVLMATCLLWCLADVFAAGGDPIGAAAASVSRLDSSTSTVSSSSSPSSTSTAAPAASPSSWRIHLQGIKALLGGDQAFDTFVTSAGSSRSAMRHLYLLYLSLQTLPYVPATNNSGGLLSSSSMPTSTPTPTPAQASQQPPPPPPQQFFSMDDFMPALGGVDASNSGGDVPPRIDGFLGYSEELLDILQQINHIANMPPDVPPPPPPPSDVPTSGELSEQGGDGLSLITPPPPPPLSGAALAAAHVLLGKSRAMIMRDAATALPVMIAEPELSATSRREFVLCHRIFQQATLIHLYRRLFRLPSCSAPIQEAVAQIQRMASQMTQGAPCSVWVAMSMPLFTVGCEACTPAQQAWSHASLDTLAASIGSMHVHAVRQALEDVWRLRARWGDTDGRLCAGQLLEELNYNIVLF